MPNYQLGKIYKVVNDVNGICYIGSTAQPTLAHRMSCHRSRHKDKKNKTYEKWGDIADCKIVLIENYPCNSKDELCARERYYIENTSCVNKIIPGQTHKEWCEKNKEHLSERKKEWREKNKEHIKKYNEDNKDKLFEQRKKYREINNEHIKKWRAENKEQRYKKFNCECGGRYMRMNKATHFKSKKHQRYLKKNKIST
jgi:hypothetical protein